MSEQPPGRPQAQSTVQAAGRVAEDVVSGLRQQPMLLGIVVLNIVGIVTAVWFLHNMAQISKENFQIVLKSCLQYLHKHDKDDNLGNDIGNDRLKPQARE